MNTIILLFSDIFRLGGIQEYNRHLCDALESQFPQARFLAISLCDVPENEFKCWKNIKIKYCGRIKMRLIQKALFVFKVLFATLIKKPDFLICAHVNLSPIALFLKKIFKLKYVTIVHGTDVWSLNHNIRYCGLEGSDKIITVSNYTRNRIFRNGIPIDKIELLQNTVDTAIFFPKKKDLDLLNRLSIGPRLVLLTVGRIRSDEVYKGHDIMLKVMQKLGNAYVWLVIGTGDNLCYLRQKAECVGVSDKVFFLGEVKKDQLVDYFNLCDIFIMPSKGEGFGIVFLEAMACGKPVIGSSKDGSVEPLMNGKLGFLVDPDNENEIIEAINLASSAKENRTNSEYLVKEVENNFGVKVFNGRVKEIFQEIVKYNN